MSDGEDQPATPSVTEPNRNSQKRSKRTRALLACQRCKHRKQRCDGGDPACSTCRRLSVDCTYVMPTHPKPGQAKVYIKALEDRVAELEMLLNNQGNIGAALDHWGQGGQDYQRSSDPGLETNFLLTAIRDLSLEVTGGYVGSTSNITLGHRLGIVAQRRLRHEGTMSIGHDKFQRRDTVTAFSEASSNSPGRGVFSINTPDPIADRMLNAYLKHLAPIQPILHIPTLKELHRRRSDLSDPYEQGILHLVYALGDHFMRTVGEDSPDHDFTQHYEFAISNRDTILQYGDIRTLKYLLLLAQHSLRVPKDAGAWTYTRVAMSLCIELGLHRKRRAQRLDLESELEKRIFWACYYLDRDISLALGRPPSISDHDIDVPPPLDVDESNEDPAVFLKASEHDPSFPASPVTNLTYFVYLNRLNRIESAIQHSIYRVGDDLTGRTKDPDETTETFLELLFVWKERIPLHTQQWESNRTENNPYVGDDSYMLLWYKCMRLLLQPQVYLVPINERYLALCTEACIGICETYKRLHHLTPIGFTTISLQAVFLAGCLTLVYCMWQSPIANARCKITRALTDCSIMLYVMTERWPAARKYRNIFEGIKDAVLEIIAEESYQPRTTITTITNDVRTTLQSLDVDMATESNRDDLEQMIRDMTGEQFHLWGPTEPVVDEDFAISGANMLDSFV